MSGKVLKFVMSFPFKQLGKLLREMSLSGDVGNIAAWAIYIGICMIPIICLGVIIKRKKWKIEDLLLFVMTAALFYAMYVMINPGIIFTSDVEMLFGGAIYSLIIGYFIIKFVRKINSIEATKSTGFIRMLLRVLNILLLVNIAFVLYDVISLYNSEDTITSIIVIIRNCMDVVPNITTVVVIVFVQKFLKEYEQKGIGEDIVVCSQRLKKVSVLSVLINVLINIFCNFIQIILLSKIHDTFINVSFPLLSMIFIMALPLIVGLIIESKDIKAENEMFV